MSSVLPKNLSQGWFNKQTYQSLAEIAEMLYRTHTINIPEWDEMQEEDLRERCQDWGIEEGNNIYHTRNRLRNASDEGKDVEPQKRRRPLPREEEPDSEDLWIEGEDSGEDEIILEPNAIVPDMRTAGLVFRDEAETALYMRKRGWTPPSSLPQDSFDTDGWAFGNGTVTNEKEMLWWNELEETFYSKGYEYLTIDELRLLMNKRNLEYLSYITAKDLNFYITNWNNNWLRHKSRAGAWFPNNPQTA